MKITNELISSFNPCEDRYDNYLAHYKDKEFSFDDFLDLENITYSDKIWVAKKVLGKNQLVHFAILCAQSVLHIFENKYPGDKRPRECLEYLVSIKDYSNLTQEQKGQITRLRRAAAYASDAAYAADSDAAATAATAAYAAAAAAAAAADAVTYADADTASAAAAAADAVTYAAAYAADAAAYASRKLQQSTNLQFLKVAYAI